MNNPIKIFEHDNLGQIRTLTIDGEPWFVGSDVASILGYEKTRNALSKHVDEEDALKRGIPTNGGIQNMTVINESGLYSLILSSKLPQAKAFKRWVTSDVLPSIRKHGAFITEETLENMLNSNEFTASLLDALEEEHAKNIELEGRVNELSSKVRYADRVLGSGETLPISVIAKDYGMSASAFNLLLKEMGIQYRLGTTWLLYQQYAGKGYTKSKTFYTPTGECVVHTYWLHRGRHFLYNILAEAGIFPKLESIAVYQEYCEPDFVVFD